MSEADPDIVSGLKITIPFKSDLCGRNLRKSLFEISEGEAGIGFGEFAFNMVVRFSMDLKRPKSVFGQLLGESFEGHYLDTVFRTQYRSHGIDDNSAPQPFEISNRAQPFTPFF